MATSYAKLLGCSLVFALFRPQLNFMKALSQSLEENILHLLRTVVAEDQPDEYAGPQCTREISVPGRRDIWVAASDANTTGESQFLLQIDPIELKRLG